MQPAFLLSAFVLTALGVVAALALALAIFSKQNRLRYIIAAVLSLLLVTAATYATGIGEPTSNVVVSLAKSVLSRDMATLFTVGSGLLAGLGIASSLLTTKSETNRVLPTIFFVSAVLSAVAALAGNVKLSATSAPQQQASDLSAESDDISVEVAHQCDFYPIRVAADGEDIYYAGVSDVTTWQGVIVKLSPKEDGTGYEESVILRGLDRPCGIAIDGDRILVSRSGQWHRASNGVLKPQSTGAVSELQDLDGDGVIDHIKDIIEELPGARTPETQHQNSAVVVGSDGRVYVSQGVRTDHTFDPDKWAGTVIVADADGSNQEIFASGFRNPFGLCFGPHGRLYCTDNDPDKNTEGEELNLVTQGNHYGFPMSHGGVKAPKGTVGPIALYHKGDLQGMTYANSQDMPDEYRDCLYVASTGSDRILRAKVSENEEAEGGLSAEFFEFVDVPSPLDVATDNNGTLYSCSFADRKIYKIGFADQKN